MMLARLALLALCVAVLSAAQQCVLVDEAMLQKMRKHGFSPVTCGPSSPVDTLAVQGAVKLEGLTLFDFEGNDVQASFLEAVTRTLYLQGSGNVTIRRVVEEGGEPDVPAEIDEDEEGGSEADMVALMGRSEAEERRRLSSQERPLRLRLQEAVAGAGRPRRRRLQEAAATAPVALTVEFVVTTEAASAGSGDQVLDQLEAAMTGDALVAGVGEALSTTTGKAVVVDPVAVNACPPSVEAAVAALPKSVNATARRRLSAAALCQCGSGSVRRVTWVFLNATGWHGAVAFCAPVPGTAATDAPPLRVTGGWPAAAAAGRWPPVGPASAAGGAGWSEGLEARLTAAHGGRRAELMSVGPQAVVYRVAGAEAAPGADACPSAAVAAALAEFGLLAGAGEALQLACRPVLDAPLDFMPSLSGEQWDRLAIRALDTVPQPGTGRVTAVSPTLLHVLVIPPWVPAPIKNAAGDFGRPLFDIATLDSAASLFQVCQSTCSAPVGVSFKRRVLWAPLQNNQLHMGEHFFLNLSAPVASGEDFVVTVSGLGDEAISLTGRYVEGDFSEVLHVTHFGFRPDDPKRAYAGLFLGSDGELPLGPRPFQLLRLDADGQRSLAYEGDATLGVSAGWPDRFDPQIYQHVLVLDFTAYTLPGQYVVSLPPYGVSMPFDISGQAFRRPLAVTAIGMYHTRCGMPLEEPYTSHVHGEEHLMDAFVHSPDTLPGWFKHKLTERPGEYAGSEEPRWNSSLGGEFIDATGGHHDAGDYGKYTYNGALVVWSLFTAIDVLGEKVLAHDSLGLPNSENGISDVLEEVLWEVKWLMNMQDPTDGGVFQILKPPGLKYEYGMPHRDIERLMLPKEAVTTGAYAAALARAARSPAMQQHDAALTQELRRRAIYAWSWLETHAAIPDEANHSKDTNDIVWHYGITYGSRDERGAAALELYALTGEAKYLRAVNTFYRPEAKTYDSVEFPDFHGYSTRTCGLWSLSAEPLPPLGEELSRRCLTAFWEGIDAKMQHVGTTPYHFQLHGNAKSWHTTGWNFPIDASFDFLLADALDPVGFKVLGKGMCQGVADDGNGLWWSSRRINNFVYLQTPSIDGEKRENDLITGATQCRDACRSSDACVAVTHAWVGFHACRFHCRRRVEANASAPGFGALLSCTESGGSAAEGGVLRASDDVVDEADTLLGGTEHQRWCSAKVPGSLVDAALAQVHYTFGGNPADYSWVTGAGWSRLRSTVDQESIMDGVGEPVSGMPVSPLVTGGYYLTSYGPHLGKPTFPSGNPFEIGKVYPMFEQPYDGWNVIAEFTIDNLAKIFAVLAAVSPAVPPGGGLASPAVAPQEETAHPKSSVKVDQDLFHGKVLGNVAVKAVSAAGICSVRWSVDQNGEGRAIKLGPRCAFSQNYELPFYRLSVEVDDCAGLRSTQSVRLNTRDYNNTAIPLQPLQTSESTIMLMHFDDSFDGSVIPEATIYREGKYRFDDENVDWIDFRHEGPKGKVLRLDGGDSGVSTVFSGRILDRHDVEEVRVEALVYIEILGPHGAWDTDILSLKKTWRDGARLSWNRWSFGTYLHFGDVTASTTSSIAERLARYQWHFLQMYVNKTHLTECLDGDCRSIENTEQLTRWQSAEDFRVTAGNFIGLLDEVHVSVTYAPPAPEVLVVEECAGGAADGSSPTALTWKRYKDTLGPLGRAAGECSVPKWQSVNLDGMLFVTDDLMQLNFVVRFVAGKEGSVGWNTVDFTGDAWTVVQGMGAKVSFDGVETLKVLSNNLGWAPQTYEDVVNLTEVLRGAPVSSVVVRMTLCGAHSFAYLVPTSGGEAQLIGQQYNWRLPQPPANVSMTASGSFSNLRIQRSGEQRCWSKADLPRAPPVAIESFHENCTGTGSMVGYNSKMGLGMWRPRFERIGGSSYVNGECKVEIWQFARLYRHLMATPERPLVISMLLAAGASGGFSLYQDDRRDGFYPHDGIGVTFELKGGAPARATIRSNNLGYEPQTITGEGELADAPNVHVLVALCGQTTTAWLQSSTSAALSDLDFWPAEGAQPFHSTPGNWRFYVRRPWLLQLNGGAVRGLRATVAPLVEDEASGALRARLCGGTDGRR